jgi:tartrate dehydratase beta subunit/fumarate hydratase class I family protein
MSMKERIVTVASTTDIVLATMWRELLAAEGIHAELGGTNMATSVYAMMPQLGAIDVFVKEADAVRARELIDEAESEDPDAAGEPDPPAAP